MTKGTASILIILLCGTMFLSCENKSDVHPHTVPGLFVDWRLLRVETDCSQSGFTTVFAQDLTMLDLNRDYTFSYSTPSQDEVVGGFTVDNENITFNPPIFSQSISASNGYLFGRRSLMISTSKLAPTNNGIIETCDVKRFYRHD